MCIRVCVCDLLIYFFVTACILCVRVRPLPFIGNSELLYFCASHLSSIFYSLSPFSLPFLSPSLLLGHQNEVLSMLHHTLLKDWLAGWNPIGTI